MLEWVSEFTKEINLVETFYQECLDTNIKEFIKL